MERQVIKPYGEDQITEHAAKVGGRRNLKEIIISTEEGEDFYYLVKKPSRAAMQAIAGYGEKKDIDGAQKIMIGCVLEGDKEAYEHDGSIYTELVKQVGILARAAKGDIKKL